MNHNRSRDTRPVAARFSAAAATYQAAAVPQRRIAARLAAWLPARAPARVIEIGCGTGAFTEWLCRRYPRARVLALDAAPGMIAQCRARLAGVARLRCRVGGLDALRGEPRVSLAVSSLALHWMHPLADALAAVNARLRTGGRLVCSVMLRGTLAELRAARRRAAPHKPPARQLPTAAALVRALRQAGFALEASRGDTIRCRYASARALVRRLHDQGVTGGGLARSGRPLNRSELRRLFALYDAACRDGRGVVASYRVWYGRARKTGPATGRRPRALSGTG